VFRSCCWRSGGRGLAGPLGPCGHWGRWRGPRGRCSHRRLLLRCVEVGVLLRRPVKVSGVVQHLLAERSVAISALGLVRKTRRPFKRYMLARKNGLCATLRMKKYTRPLAKFAPVFWSHIQCDLSAQRNPSFVSRRTARHWKIRVRSIIFLPMPRKDCRLVRSFLTLHFYRPSIIFHYRAFTYRSAAA
jgi:hypothetical protein